MRVLSRNRNNGYLVSFIVVTALNLFLQYKIRFHREIRTSWKEVYIKPFAWMDLLVALGILFLVSLGTYLFINKWYTAIKKFINRMNEVKIAKFHSVKGFFFIFIVWFFFLMVFYPGTAMNDTIFILEDPLTLSNQHPIIYNLYTFVFYRFGCLCGHPNWGILCLSLIQMLGMDYVLVKGMTYGYKKGIPNFVCVLLSIYFAFAPLYFTYAFSAIKDTPFSICLFLFILLLIEWKDCGGKCVNNLRFCIELIVSVFGILSFRNNGILIIVGMLILLWFYMAKKKAGMEWNRKILGIIVGTMLLQQIICAILTPSDVEAQFQEKIGIPLQQVAAAVVKGKPLTEEQGDYLYKLLPQEKWQLYAPGCADNLKWNDDFDREYLNQTKSEFIKIWGELLIQNPKEYVESYILATYGMWGIESRNKEQVYVKRIYENDLGLRMQSPLPHAVYTFFYQYYCNRATYGYLSIGTTIWLLFTVTLWLLWKRQYDVLTVTGPLWMLWISLLIATPVSFCFRYGFIYVMTVPFYIFIPFLQSVCEGK